MLPEAAHHTAIGKGRIGVVDHLAAAASEHHLSYRQNLDERERKRGQQRRDEQRCGDRVLARKRACTGGESHRSFATIPRRRGGQ
ncbi:hypothetical protein HRbin41_00144 [bacterium HR41]|nr:hypothetical protein HRbin41_00144 [bacterium HR41]